MYHLSVVDEVITIKSVLWLMSWIAWNIIINFWNRSKILSGFNFAKGFKFLPRAIEYGATRVQQIQLNFLRSSNLLTARHIKGTLNVSKYDELFDFPFMTSFNLWHVQIYRLKSSFTFVTFVTKCVFNPFSLM